MPYSIECFRNIKVYGSNIMRRIAVKGFKDGKRYRYQLIDRRVTMPKTRLIWVEEITCFKMREQKII